MNMVQIVSTLSSEGHFFVFDENEKDSIFEQTEHVGVMVYTLCLISLNQRQHMAGDSSLN